MDRLFEVIRIPRRLKDFHAFDLERDEIAGIAFDEIKRPDQAVAGLRNGIADDDDA